MIKKTKLYPKIIEFTFAMYPYFPNSPNSGEKLILKVNKITFERHSAFDHDSNLVVSCVPSDRRWEEFSLNLDTLKVWKWSKNYRNFGVEDGGGWDLCITTTSSIIESHGSNKEPSNFNEFLDSINKLMGIEVFDLFEI